jgi:hypothetical protein
MKKINLFGTEIQGLSPYSNAQMRLNCFYEVDNSNEKDVKIFVRPTPGCNIFVTLPSSPIRGSIVINNLLYVVAGNTLYSVNTTGTVTALGVMTSFSATNVGMAYNGVQLIICAGTTGWIYTLVTGTYSTGVVTAGTFAQITAAAYPTGATSVCFLNGAFIANNPASNGQFQTSTFYDGTSWPALNFATAETSPDVLLGLDAWQGTLILWGQTHIEYWQDTGASLFPFTQLVGTAQNFGLAAVQSRVLFKGSMIFLGRNPAGQVQVMLLNGYSPEPVSDSNIDYLINNLSTISDAVGFSYVLNGHHMYQLTFPTAQKSFLFDGGTGLWSILQTGVGLSGRHIAQNGIAFGNNFYITDSSSGNLYRFSTDYTSDNGTTIKRQIQTRHIQGDGNRFGVDELWLDMQIGAGLTVGQGQNPQLMMQVSKDNGNTWGNERWVSIGQQGQYVGPRAIWRRIGQGRDFVFRFTLTDPVPFVVIRGSAMIRPTEEGSQ